MNSTLFGFARAHWRALLLIATPLAIGSLAAVVLPPLTLQIGIDAWAAFLYGGVLLSMLLALASLIVWRDRQRQRAALNAQVQAAREQAADERRRFLRRLDHELKNPLMAIRAGLANLPRDEARTHETIERVDVQTLRLSNLVSNLRKLADIETQPLDRSQVSLENAIHEAVALARGHDNASARRVVLSLPTAPWPVSTLSGDYDLLVLAIYNLIENALKYSAAESTVEVRALEDGNDILIDVANTGSSIPEAELVQVFDELYRGEDVKHIAGSGLGLALVRTVIARHAGTINARSRPGQGTVFSIRLPRAVTKP
jgi:two-component system, OmpR family, sensor kinase